jgi:hypothetical protein
MHTADIEFLALLVQRLLDAEVLRDAEGATLLAEADAACRSFQDGDLSAARQHIAEVALFTEALVQTDQLELRDGRAVLTTARGILSQPAGEDA